MKTKMESEKNFTLEKLDQLERASYLPLTVFLVILMFIGIVGNILVLIIYKRNFTRSSARCYILSLAIADLSVSVVAIPYHVLDLTLILTYTHSNVCRILSFLIGACTLSSVFILLVVGLDRYFKVCRPLKRQIKDFGDRKACLLASFVAIVISIPHGIIYGESTVLTQANNLTGVECFISDEYQGSGLAVGYLGFNLLIFLLSVIYLVIIYGFICRKIYNHDRKSGEISLKEKKKFGLCCSVQSTDDCAGINGAAIEVDERKSCKSNTGHQRIAMKKKKKENVDRKSLRQNMTKSKRNTNSSKTVRNSCEMVRHVRPGSKALERNALKITLMMLTITVVFIVSYLPFIIISILDSIDEGFWDGRTIVESVFLDCMLRLYLVNNVSNPVIYSFWDEKFRRETKLLLIRLSCCFDVNEEDLKHSNRSGKSAFVTTKGINTGTAKSNDTA